MCPRLHTIKTTIRKKRYVDAPQDETKVVRDNSITRRMATSRKAHLRTALRLFLKKGYDGVSFEEIAREAGAGKMTFYRYFGSKEELFRLVLSETMERLFEALALPEVSEMSIEYLTEIVRHIYDGYTEPQYIQVQRLVIASYEKFPELAQQFRAYKRFLLNPLVDVLSKAADRGQLIIEDPNAAAYQLSALASGGVRFLNGPRMINPVRKEKWIRSVATFAWNSWRPDSAESTKSR